LKAKKEEDVMSKPDDTRIAEEAALFAEYALPRSHFFAAGKVRQAVRFSIELRARRLAVPTKLAGTSQHQEALVAASASPVRFRRLVPSLLYLREDRAALAQGIGLSLDGQPIGEIQRKHLSWLLPLMETGNAPSFWLMAITGGTEDRPTRGANIVIGDIAEAIRAYGAQHRPAGACRVREETAAAAKDALTRAA
jgi:hypothetical protein